jgi:RNA polymerase sigma-70 factor (ECF subfamily)
MPHLTDDERQQRKARFMELFLPVRDRLHRFARAMARTAEDADDLVSETVLAAFEGFDTIRDQKAFLSFLLTIAVRRHRSTIGRRKFFGEYDEGTAGSIPHPGPAPDAAAESAMLHAALGRLPGTQREAIVLFELAGLSLEDVREVQGGSLSGVKSRIVRGRRRLAELLGANDEDRSRSADRLDLPTSASPVDPASLRFAAQNSHE